MEWIELLHRKTVGLDTAPMIYFMERNPRYLATLRGFFQGLERGDFRAVTSVVTLIEVLTRPLQLGNKRLADDYRDILFGTAGLLTIPLSRDVAEQAAQLRAAHGLRTPDAVQLATATLEQASFFLTNDARFLKVPDPVCLFLDQLVGETNA